MRIIHDSLEIETGYNVLGVEEVCLEQELNAHGKLSVTFLCSPEAAQEITARSSAADVIKVYDGGVIIFSGMLARIVLQSDRSETVLHTVWKDFTAKMDGSRKNLAFTGETMTYADIAEKITAEYGRAYCNVMDADTVISGLLLQYGETDWEFLVRLAGRNGTVLVADGSKDYPYFHFGLTGGKPVEIADADSVTRTAVSFEEYARREAVFPLTAFMQDCTRLRVRSEEWHPLGQSVVCGLMDGVVERVQIKTNGSLVERYYDIVPPFGVKAHSGINPHYSGLHLSATVTEVKDTVIRADFAIGQYAQGEERYFPYAVESSAWYCMPEVGTSVHIYLPENDETSAYAVHSMRNTAGGAKHAQATADPSVKSYTHPDGSAMQLDGDCLLLTADGTGTTQASLGKDGVLELKAKKITVYSAKNIHIGKPLRGSDGTAPAENVAIASGTDISLIKPDSTYTYLGEAAFLKGGLVTNMARIHDMVEIPAEILSRNDGIDIAAINDAAKEYEKQKIKEAKQKVGMGLFCMVAGAVAIAVVGVCTCGAGLVVAGAVAGTIAYTCGAGLVEEGMQDYQKAVSAGDFSKSHNFVRDDLLGGNQQLYDILTYGSVLICGIVIGVATGGGGMAALKQVLARAGTEMALDFGMNLIGDYIDDGCINNGWESYFKSACMTGACSGMSQGIMNKFKGLEAAGKLSCKALGNLRLVADVSLDAFVSFATTGEVNLAKLLLQNYLANKLTMADPVDAATGSLYIPAVDMRLPGLDGDFTVSRRYESVNPRAGLLGQGWTCSAESFLQYRGDACSVLCADGHVEGFHKKDGAWRNDKGGSGKISLAYDAGQNLFVMHDIVTHMSYFYGEGGRLVRVEDGTGHRSQYLYADGILCGITTFTGLRIGVSVSDGRLRELVDVLGRTVRYEYDDRKRLVRVNQNGRGITRYEYDGKGRITGITDQNNKRYTVNAYDSRGRVTRQDYPDGTCCEISYDDTEGSASFYYPETGGRQTAFHNADGLVTRMEYQDGTREEYEYDAWQNRTAHRDRNGNLTRWEYAREGFLRKETDAGGLETVREYDGGGHVVSETDNAGGCIRYAYDACHRLVRKDTLLSSDPQEWGTEGYEYDRHGRCTKKTDARGNATRYRYADETMQEPGGAGYFPTREISPSGNEYAYAYDAAGRKTHAKTADGSVHLAYNSLNHVICTTDGEGNGTHDDYDNLGSPIRHHNARQWEKGRSGGHAYEYDYLDRLIKVRDAAGRVKTFRRNGQGSIVYESLSALPAQAPENGMVQGITSTYDANENLICMTCPDGGEWHTEYDGEGNLTHDRRPGGMAERRYTYDAMNRLTGVTADGRTEHTYAYDKKGHVIRETDASGNDTLYAYDNAGRMTGKWEHAFSDGAGSGGERRRYRVTQYLYDPAGNMVEERRGSDAADAYEYPHAFFAIRKEYDGDNRLVAVGDDTGARVTYTYDAMNNRTGETRRINEQGAEHRAAYTYDRAGRLVRKTVTTDRDILSGGNAAKTVSITGYGYDAAGNLTEVRLPGGGRLRIVYDQADRPIYFLEADKRNGILRGQAYCYADTCALPWENLHAREGFARRLNQRLMTCVSLSDYRDAETGNLICAERPCEIRHYAGKKAKGLYRELYRVYEEADRWNPEEMAAVDYGEPGTDYHAEHYAYNHRGQPTRTEDTCGGKYSAEYDGFGNLTMVTSPYGYQTRYGHDRDGNTVSKTNALGIREYLLEYDATGNVASHTDGNGNTTKYARDASGNVVRVTGPDGKTDRSVTYDVWGRQLAATNGNGNTTTYTRDRAGRVTTVTNPDGSREHYGYDCAGNITSGTDGNGNKTQFLYNGANRLERIIKADGTERLFGYDSEERCTFRRDEDGNTVRMGYNLDGNMVLASGTPEGLGAPAISSIYRYDARGFLTSAMEGNTAYHYKRDSEGRVTEKADSRGKLFEVVYNPDGTIGRIGGTRYYYNFAGQMTCVMSDCGIGANYEYDTNGALIKTECDNGLITTYTRDSRGRLESLRAGFAGETALLDAKYTYDGNGNRTGKEELFFMEKGSVPTRAVTQYAYDSMNRLTMESRNGLATTYTYDMAGNRTSRLKGDDREEYRYNSRNQLTELTGMGRRTSCQYDPAGNLTQEQRFIQERAETRKYTYDAYNRNTEVRGEDFLHKNFYDAEGLRNRIEENGKATDFVYSGDMLYSEREVNSTRERRYILGNEYLGHEDTVQDVTFSGEKQKQEYSYITDEQGSLRYILNADRQTETYQEYSAFGERIFQEGASSRLGYNSQMGDELTGLTYLRARYYNPEIGRLTQEDVIYDDGFNLYAYCGSNPIIYNDPSGLKRNVSCKSKANPNRVGTGTTKGGQSRTTKSWRKQYGPASAREHHLIPQALLKNDTFMKQMHSLGIKNVKEYLDKQIALISNSLHIDVHADGWNDDWLKWVQNNRNFTLKDLQNNIKDMMKLYNIPNNSRNHVKMYGKN